MGGSSACHFARGARGRLIEVEFSQVDDHHLGSLGKPASTQLEIVCEGDRANARPACQCASQRWEILRMAIRIVVVGMGPRGQQWVREIQKNDRYELSACVDVDPSALQHAV